MRRADLLTSCDRLSGATSFSRADMETFKVGVNPCVIKFYVFDLGERKSFIKLLLKQCHNVCVMSGRNPCAGAGRVKRWEDRTVTS